MKKYLITYSVKIYNKTKGKLTIEKLLSKKVSYNLIISLNNMGTPFIEDYELSKDEK